MRKGLSIWLYLCALLVALMVALGGYTRLSGSGLSMVEWSIGGFLPPFNEEQWEREFAKYQEYSQYQIENRWMALADFKPIYLVEYSHRALGRLLGGVFILGFLWFWLNRAFSISQGLLLIVTGSLIGAQGLLGWHMVQSGLGDNPMVAPLFLVGHLGMAMIIYSLLVWQGWRFGNVSTIFRCNISGILKKSTVPFCLFVLFVIVSGGFVAALGGTPPDLLADLPQMSPLINITEFATFHQNMDSVFLLHRLMAVLMFVWGAITAVGLMGNNDARISSGGSMLLVMLVTQVGLGAMVIVSEGNWVWAWVHQLGGLLLLPISINVALAANR